MALPEFLKIEVFDNAGNLTYSNDRSWQRRKYLDEVENARTTQHIQEDSQETHPEEEKEEVSEVEEQEKEQETEPETQEEKHD